MFVTIKAFFGSLGLHVLMLGGLLITFSFDSGKTVQPQVASNLPEPVLAEILDANQVEKEVAQLQAFEQKKRDAEKDRQNKLQADAEAARKKRQAEEKRLATLASERKIAEKRKAELEKQRLQEEQNLKELALKKQQQAEEKARLEAENKRIAAEQAELAAKRAEQEQKAKAEELARQKAEAERKAKEVAAAKKKAAEAARRKRLENDLAAAIAAEENNGEQARDRELYRGLIAQAVQRQWVRPISVAVAECVLRVTQIPGGEVVRVEPQASRCGGDDLFKRSLVKAVEDASPLPAPPNPDVFEREIEFLFRPE